MNCEKFRGSSFAACGSFENVVCHGKRREKGKKYVLVNSVKEELCKVEIDGGYIKSEKQQKCDFLIILCSRKVAIFVELKGTHISDAYRQTLSTIEFFEKEIRTSNTKVFVRIVSRKVPNLNKLESIPSRKELKKKLQSLNKVNKALVEKTREYKEDVVKLV